MNDSKELLVKLANCVAACENCADACLDEGNIEKMKDCIRTDRDCADICNTTARLVARDSDSAASLLEICEDICRQCAEECEQHEAQHCKDCAEACRDCEKACQTV